MFYGIVAVSVWTLAFSDQINLGNTSNDVPLLRTIMYILTLKAQASPVAKNSVLLCRFGSSRRQNANTKLDVQEIDWG